jgi:diguanylate cyclase (GGDEF)-like protein
MIHFQNPFPESMPTENLMVLNFAIRLLTNVTNRALLIDNALEIVADFANCEPVAFFETDEAGCLRPQARLYHAGRLETLETAAATENPALRAILTDRRIALYPRGGCTLPLPEKTASSSTGFCLCLPVVCNGDRVQGILTLARAERQLAMETFQHLHVLGAILAVSLENARLFELAVIDGLTGVYVRRYFDLRIAEEIGRLSRGPGDLAVAFLDVDCFKEINDLYGHDSGDRTLREIARLLRYNVRENHDVVCRYGGDEFIILMPNATLKDAAIIAERLRGACEQEHFPGLPDHYRVTLTIGITSVSGPAPGTVSELLHKVDRLLYQGKRQGRNQVFRQ